MEQDKSIIVLPTGVTGRMDVGRLVREVDALDQFLEQAAVRKPGTPMQMPKTSKLLDEMLETNKINALVEDDRKRLLNFLITVRAKAPVMHMSFSADPAPLFTQKLVTWLRDNIHPLVLLHVGIQPNIGAGCIVRTTNKQFDLSLKQDFAKQHPLLMAKIHGSVQEVSHE
ncbi:hypothetical protein KDA00_02075 [Candidatus Saccharibacteria bacterium]|nr:hypothetical protein [Candidatus Saccharibacteria bacterium]